MLSTSVVIDLTTDSRTWEDSAKFLGIAGWTAFLVRAAGRPMGRRRRSGSPHARPSRGLAAQAPAGASEEVSSRAPTLLTSSTAAFDIRFWGCTAQ